MVVEQGAKVPWLATPLAIATVLCLAHWLRAYRRARREAENARRYVPAFEAEPAHPSAG
jgi:hypothetical protein